MQSILAINSVSLCPSGGLEQPEPRPDGGFALDLDDGEAGGGERSEDACLFPMQTLASLWAGVGGVAGVGYPDADRVVSETEAALSVGTHAIGSGVLAEGAGGSPVPAIPEAGGLATMVERGVFPQPEDGFATVGSVGRDRIGADGTMSAERPGPASLALAVSEPYGEAGMETPPATGMAATLDGDKDAATTASGSDLTQGERAVARPIPVSLPLVGPVETVDWGSVASPSLAPPLNSPVIPSPKTDLDAVLSILPDNGETAPRSGISDAAPIVAPQMPGPEMPGSISALPLLPTGAIPNAAAGFTRMSANTSASKELTQLPVEGERESSRVLARPEDVQPQQRGFWDWFITEVHPESGAEPAKGEPNPPALAVTGFHSNMQGHGIGEPPDRQSSLAFTRDLVRQPIGHAAQANPSISIASGRMPTSADPVTELASGRELNSDANPLLTALSAGLPATPRPTSTVVPQPSTLPTPQVSAQIVAGLSTNREGTTELALAPEELGHVRLKLKPDAANPDRMVVMISFERLETLDLFRRHIGDLAEALRTAGYAGVDIGFGQEGSGTAGSDRSRHSSSSAVERAARPDCANPIETTPRLMAGASLDLRL